MVPKRKIKSLIVDDEQNIRKLLQMVLAGQQRTVFMAEAGRMAINLFRRERPDPAILDLKQPDVSGLEGRKRSGGNGSLHDGDRF